MSPEALAVAASLADLCRRAGAAPGDGSEWAGRLVADALVREGVRGDASCPIDCPLNRWLRTASGVGGVLMGVTHAILLHPPTGLVRKVPRRVEVVPLPGPVAAAARLVSELRVRGLSEAA